MKSQTKKTKSDIIKVFIADDHALLRDGLRSILEREDDVKVIGEAANGKDTVQQVKKLKPDVVTMDISMPLLNGIEATRRICEACPKTHVLILSMYATTEHIYHALKAGARGYLLKESAGTDTVNAIRTAYTGERYLSPKVARIMADDYVFQEQTSGKKNLLENLSQRETEILQLLTEGKSTQEIAKNMHLARNTIDTYKSRLMQKLGIHNLHGLIKFAMKHGLIPPEQPADS
ncbi:response regulator [Verrucomicrobiota bacterium]